MPDIGHLFIHELTWQRKLRAVTGSGAVPTALTPIKTVRGRVNPASSREKLQAQQMKASVTHVIYLDPGTDVKKNDVFVYGVRNFRVTVPDIEPSIVIYRKVFVEHIQTAVVA